MSISHLLLTTLILTVAIAARYLLVVVAVYALVWGRKEGRDHRAADSTATAPRRRPSATN